MTALNTWYISIGNSDNKLTQYQWSTYCSQLERLCRAQALEVYGVWYSAPASEYQNMCVAIGIERGEPSETLPHHLGALCEKYGQDSIAVADALTTFVTLESARAAAQARVPVRPHSTRQDGVHQ